MPTATPFIVNETTLPTARIGSFADLLNLIFPLLTIGVALLLLVMFLIGALGWVSAGDNAENLKKAQQTITYAVLGLIIVVMSFLVVRIIGVLFNISLPF